MLLKIIVLSTQIHAYHWYHSVSISSFTSILSSGNGSLFSILKTSNQFFIFNNWVVLLVSLTPNKYEL